MVWGALNGIYLIVGSITERIRNNINKKLGFSNHPKFLKSIQMIITFSLFAFSLMIFRANNGKDAIILIKHLPQQIINQCSSIANFRIPFQELFSSSYEFISLLLSFSIFCVVEIVIKNKGIDGVMRNRPRYVRNLIYYFFIIWLLFFGMLGEPQEFVYFQF